MKPICITEKNTAETCVQFTIFFLELYCFFRNIEKMPLDSSLLYKMRNDILFQRSLYLKPCQSIKYFTVHVCVHGENSVSSRDV